MSIFDRLDELQALADAATPGPWVSGSWTGLCSVEHKHSPAICKYEYSINRSWYRSIISKVDQAPVNVVTTTDEYGALSRQDSKFIAMSRTAVPVLVQALKVAYRALEDYPENLTTRKTIAEMVGALDGKV